jgi:hypothetical protein
MANIDLNPNSADDDLELTTPVEGAQELGAKLATPSAHDLGGAEHNADTFANLNSKVSGETLFKQSDIDSPADLGRIRRTGTTTFHTIKDVRAAGGVSPTVSNDNTEGYEVGSLWRDITNKREWRCHDASTGAAVWVEITFTSSIQEAAGDTTTTSATDVLMDSMTVTPEAGTYLVWFQGSLQHSSTNDSIFTSIYSGGVQVAASERVFLRGGASADVSSSFACMAKVTVNGSQAIEGQWRTTAATATAHERQLLILKVG